MKKIFSTIIFSLFVVLLGFTLNVKEVDAASPGLYNSNGKLVYSWSQLTGNSVVKGGILKVKNGVLSVTDNYVVTGTSYDEEWGYEDIEKSASEFLVGKLVISSNVTAISDYCFSYCGLTSIELPSGLKKIGEWAFAGTNITELHIPKNVTTIENGITTDCNKLKKITVANANKTYNSKNNCNAIIKTLNKELVAGCKNTKIPSDTKIIGVHAFRECLGITSVEIPKSVTTIKNGAFNRCYNLKKVILSSGLKTIEEAAFYDCYILNNITLPKTVKKVGQIAFMCVPVVHHQTNLKSTYWEADRVHKGVAGKCDACGKQITVKFDANGGTAEYTSQKIYNKMTYVQMPNATKKGYTFVGWYTKKSGGKRVYCESTSISKSNHTLYARWEVKKNKIKYNYNGGHKIGEKDNPTTYTINQTIQFASPAKTGYTFAGWYRNGKKVTSIAKGTTGKIELTAKWTPITYTIKFYSNGATSGTMKALTNVKYDEIVKLENKFKKYGYTFKGWSLKKNGSVKYVNNKSVSKLTFKKNEVVSLYACWQLNEVTESGNIEKNYKAYYKSSVVDKVVCMDYTFANDYFSSNGSINKKLAKASIALASASYNKEYAVASLNEMGFDVIDCYNYDKNANMTDNDFVAYVVATKTITVNGKDKNLIMVLVRGTTGNGEWYSNFNMGQEAEHKGFYKAAKEIENTILNYFYGQNVEDNILWITGHSRGAAVANIVAGKYSIDEKYSNLVTSANVYGYTFACPTVSMNADSTLNNIYNFCNEGDVVTQVPLKDWSYKRFGQSPSLEISNNIRTKFKDITSIKFEGFTSGTNTAASFANWIPTVEEFYEEKEVELMFEKVYLSKVQIMNSLATIALVGNSTADEKETAYAVIIAALGGKGIDLPLEIATAYLGDSFVREVTNGETDVKDIKDIVSAKGVYHSHCPELYYAWASYL